MKSQSSAFAWAALAEGATLADAALGLDMGRTWVANGHLSAQNRPRMGVHAVHEDQAVARRAGGVRLLLKRVAGATVVQRAAVALFW